MSKNIIAGVFVLFFSIFGIVSQAEARENVTDWYVQDFHEDLALATDSTMAVTEWITADCGEATGKHGIYRVIPTAAHTENGTIPMPIQLVSITDFDGVPYPFTSSEDRKNQTITWKIGDPDKTVTGVNHYKITYQVKNVMRFGGESLDEWYYNVSGNFWTFDIDAFSARITFPEGVQQDQIALAYYTGMPGAKEHDLARYEWLNSHTLSFVAIRTLHPGEGITVSASVPKGIFVPYQFSWWELYSQYLWFVLPLAVLGFCYRMWRSYGDDPQWDKVVIPEYEPPKSLSIIEFGMLMTNGNFKNEFVTAAIVQLAVRGYLTISEEERNILFFSTKDFVLTKQPLPVEMLASDEQIIYDKLFETGDIVSLSSLKNTFSPVLGLLQQKAVVLLSDKGLIEKKGLSFRQGFLIVGVVVSFLAFSFFATFSIFGMMSGLLTGLILIVFGLIMPKRLLKGVEVNWQIQGLKLYMDTAEKYRQRFYEKENIFDTLLPYAIVFGMTREWIEKARDVYGAEYFSSYHPVWFMSSGVENFNADEFASHMESLSSAIASNTGTSAGSGGSGSSGGGGGGGGGGGW